MYSGYAGWHPAPGDGAGRPEVSRRDGPGRCADVGRPRPDGGSGNDLSRRLSLIARLKKPGARRRAYYTQHDLDLEGGDLKMAVGCRRNHAAVLEDWPSFESRARCFGPESATSPSDAEPSRKVGPRSSGSPRPWVSELPPWKTVTPRRSGAVSESEPGAACAAAGTAAPHRPAPTAPPRRSRTPRRIGRPLGSAR